MGGKTGTGDYLCPVLYYAVGFVHRSHLAEVFHGYDQPFYIVRHSRRLCRRRYAGAAGTGRGTVLAAPCGNPYRIYYRVHGAGLHGAVTEKEEVCIMWKCLQREMKILFYRRRMVFLVLIVAASAYALLIGTLYQQQTVQQIPVLVCNLDQSALSRQLVQDIASADRYRFMGTVNSEEEGRQMLEQQQAEAVIVIPRDFSETYYAGRPVSLAYLQNGTNTLAAGYASQPIQSVWASWLGPVPGIREYGARDSLAVLGRSPPGPALYSQPCPELSVLLCIWCHAHGGPDRDYDGLCPVGTGRCPSWLLPASWFRPRHGSKSAVLLGP